MSKLKLKRRSPGELRYLIMSILMDYRLGYETSREVMKRIYAEVVATAVDDERQIWEQLNRAKESGSIN